MTSKSASNAGKSQVDKFREAARELDTNQSEQDFDVLVRRIAKTPPPKDDKGNREDTK